MADADIEAVADADIEAEAMALPAAVRAAAAAIEASAAFRSHYSPAHPLGRLHPAAVEFARLAYAALQPEGAPDEDRVREAMAEAQDHPGRTVTR